MCKLSFPLYKKEDGKEDGGREMWHKVETIFFSLIYLQINYTIKQRQVDIAIQGKIYK